MEFLFFFKGIGFGLAVAVPVGPIGILCIQRSLSQGYHVGLLTGFGSATADAIYGAVAAFGLGAAATILEEQSTWFRLVGGVFMLILGLRVIRTRTGQPAAGFASNDSLTRVAALSAFGSALLLTLANPTTILSFVAIFAGLGLIDADNHMAAGGAMVGGVFLGSILWWVILSGVASRLGGIAGEQRVRWISRTSGAVIVAFGVAALVSLL